MNLHKKCMSFALSLLIAGGTSISAGAHDGVMESKRIEICEAAYSITYTDKEFFIEDYYGRSMGKNRADMIQEIFEFRWETYLVNHISGEDGGRKQLWKINIPGEKENGIVGDYEIIEECCYDVFESYTAGIVLVYKKNEDIYSLTYNSYKEEEQVEIDMAGFREYGGFRNLKEIDIIDSEVYFLTLAGELIEYNMKKEEFKRLSDDFIYSIREGLTKDEIIQVQ